MLSNLRIWAHTVSGAGPNDLQNINGLNHYIGMKTIEPDALSPKQALEILYDLKRKLQ